MAVSQNCMKRLMHDLEELKKSPGNNVSALPLEDNLLEWHCNIQQESIIFHVILFFPEEYPSKPPSAEFVPREFSYGTGATKHGRKGTQICLSIFSDFEYVHQEWANEKNHGWSPGYTVQTILMNLVSFLADNQTTTGTNYVNNLHVSKKFTCPDCGHSYLKPYPSLGNTGLDQVDDKPSILKTNIHGDAVITQIIVDYYSKEKLSAESPQSDVDLFGYGLICSGEPGRSKLTTPCEFLTIRSFLAMKNTRGTARSVCKDPISFMLPLYIHPNHGSHIRDQFESVMHELSEGVIANTFEHVSVEDMVLKTLPNLMCSTLVYLFKELKKTNENSLNGFFGLHRLFLWALDTYPSLQGKVEMVLKEFVEDKKKRIKASCPDIGQWLMLLAASEKYRWKDVAEAYLNECFRRNVMWYVKTEQMLGNVHTSQEYRLKHTFQHTVVSRNLLAFQVVFLDIAMPASMSRDQIVQRYDENWGFPTQAMLTKMKDECHKINNEIYSYADWYTMLNLPVPTKEEMNEILVSALIYAKNTQGYYFSSFLGK